jgi:hypothetical protein
VAALGSFVHFRVEFDAGSGSYSPAENGQYTETRTVPSTNPVGYYSQHIWQMKNAGGTFTDRERAMFGVHWLNLTSGEVDTTWTAADYLSVESAVEAFFTAQLAKISSDIKLIEHRWYAYGIGVVPPNPPSRITTIATPLVGTNASFSAHQMSSTVTLRTSLRRHWGRIYMPIADAATSTGGQFSSSTVDSLAASARTMLMVTPSAQGIVPVVYDRTRHILNGVTAVEVDSVPDVVRRRRPRDSAYKKIYTS